MLKKIWILLLLVPATAYVEGLPFTGKYFGWSAKRITNEINRLVQEKDDSALSNTFKIGALYIALAVEEPPVPQASIQAKNLMERYVKRNREDPLGLCYLALSYSLMARDDSNVVKKTYYMNLSFQYYDRAIRLSPDDWYIHFMRGNSYVHLPSFFGKDKTAVTDFRFIEKKFKDGEAVSDGIMAQVFYYLGQAEKSSGKLQSAIEYWKKSLKYAKKSGNESFEKKSQKMLDIFND